MRQRNHCSSLKGIPKMKLQDSGPSGPKSLQSQNRQRPENRLSISRLDVVNAQRVAVVHMAQVWLRLADDYEDGNKSFCRSKLAEQAQPVVQQQQQIQPKKGGL